jgi:hypothetical protein
MLYNLKEELSRQRFASRVRKLWKDGAIVELTDKRRRTGNQNRYCHLILGILAMETGNSLECVKTEIFKKRVNPDLFVAQKDDPVLGQITVLRSSRDLTTEQMTLAIDRYMKFCSELGIYIPSPEDEALIEQVEYELSKVDKWL